MTDRYQTIVLHVGLPKTGTTSIQGNCYRYRDLLLQHGVCYPAFTFDGRTMVNHSDCLTGAILDRPGKYGAAFRQHVHDEPLQLRAAMRPQLDQLLTQPRASTLVLSAESIAEYQTDDMLAVRQWLAPYAHKLRVIAYIRSPQSTLPSILAQRVRSGMQVEPEELVAMVRQRYQNLHSVFGEALELVNFHDAVRGSGGLVAHFMQLLGLPVDATAALAFTTSNERITLEAYRIMRYINARYPRPLEAEHGVLRKPNDLHPLNAFPGQPFTLDGFAGSALHAATLEEAGWLEQQLGFSFPAEAVPAAPAAQQLPWQPQTLRALEQAVRQLEHEALRTAAVDCLAAEAVAVQPSRPAVAAVLAFIVDRLRHVADDPSPRVLQQLGADYFKFAALQVERASPRLAQQLMTLAEQLRPGANFISERLQKYRRELGQ